MGDLGMSLDEIVRCCPFVRVVADGRLVDAERIALAGPEPADPIAVPLLVRWAEQIVVGEPLDMGARP